MIFPPIAPKCPEVNQFSFSPRLRMATNYSRSTCNTFNIQTTHACNEACATSTTLTNASFTKCMRPTSLIKFIVNNFYGCVIWKCLFYIIVLILLAICVALQFFISK
uniref:Uncharacterized protein n=1 Tax=Rhipicephalus microplus TaxID=6941 RepID=A0A6G5AG40_RHIMP